MLGEAAGVATNSVGGLSADVAALQLIGNNSNGPVLVGKTENTILLQQQGKRFDELAGLFDRSSSTNGVVIDEKLILEGANPVNSRTTKILDSTGLSDQQIRNYAQQLAGSQPLKQVSLDVWLADLGGGQQIRLRSVSSSQAQTGARWTIDIQNIPSIQTTLPSSARKVELKFK